MAAKDWREQVKKDKLERKLRKMAYRLARFAKRHGIDYLGIGAYVRVVPKAYVTVDGWRFEVPLEGDLDE